MYVDQRLTVTLQNCKGHFHVAMVISVASAHMVAVLLQSLTTNSWKQNVAIRMSMRFVHVHVYTCTYCR